MDDFQTIDLPHETGEAVTLTLWFRDEWEVNFDSNRTEADCVAHRGQIEIGNWRADLDRPALLKMIGADRLKAYEDERSEALEAQGVAA
jgi:hypothetical protein